MCQRAAFLPGCVKALLLNLFALGLVLNLVTLTSINWVVGENYVIGLLQYCKGFDQAHAARHYAFYNRASQLIHQPLIDDLKCYAWATHNRPSPTNRFQLSLQARQQVLMFFLF